MGETCLPDELRTLFLFEALTDEQLQTLCDNGHIQTYRTSQRGVYCGAWSAYIPGAESTYAASVRVTRPSRFFVLDADAFARFMQAEFPMAVHLLEGHTVGSERARRIIGQREKLLALGQ